jgi:hypothetical protein
MRFPGLVLLLAMVGLFALCKWTHPVAVQPEPSAMIINEFMASNGAGVYLDENSEPDDWVELYNTATTSTSLRGLYLSDDSAKLDKFALPDTLVPAHGFILVWADNQKSQGRLHASFKLSSRSGEKIFLSQGEKTLIDSVRFLPDEVSSDQSFGRWTDGASNWARQIKPTPGSTNSGGVLGD